MLISVIHLKDQQVQVPRARGLEIEKNMLEGIEYTRMPDGLIKTYLIQKIEHKAIPDPITPMDKNLLAAPKRATKDGPGYKKFLEAREKLKNKFNVDK